MRDESVNDVTVTQVQNVVLPGGDVHVLLESGHDTVQPAAVKITQDKHRGIGVLSQHVASTSGCEIRCRGGVGTGGDVDTADDECREFPWEVKGTQRQGQHLYVWSTDGAVDLDVRTPPFINKDANTPAPTLTGLSGPVCPQCRKVVKTDLRVRDIPIQPGLGHGDYACIPEGPLHLAFGVQNVHFISERAYVC